MWEHGAGPSNQCPSTLFSIYLEERCVIREGRVRHCPEEQLSFLLLEELSHAGNSNTPFSQSKQTNKSGPQYLRFALHSVHFSSSALPRVGGFHSLRFLQSSSHPHCSLRPEFYHTFHSIVLPLQGSFSFP